MMRKHLILSVSSIALVCGLMFSSTTALADVYELRTYTTHEGKLDNLHARFRDHTVKLFEKYGIESVGYWVPTEGPKSENTLIYIIRHKSRDAAKNSWKAFGTDPAWRKAAAESRKDGRLVKKVESVYMDVADYSPKFANAKQSKDAVFELRVYRTGDGKLDNLDARFRDHTIGIFSRYGMQSVGYWHPSDEPNSKDTLIYVLRYDSREAAKKGWASFRQDEQWKKAYAESTKEGRLLRESPESVYMRATDYSAIK